MPAPGVPPSGRDAADIRPAAHYRPGDRVWVYRFGGWRPGQIWQASTRAVGVRYRPTPGSGVSADSVTADQVAVRDEVDQLLDRPTASDALPMRTPDRPGRDQAPGRG